MTGLVWLDRVDVDTALRLAGPKMGRLAELQRAGLRVPLSFAVSTEAFRSHFAATGLDQEIVQALAGVTAEDDAAVATASDKAQQAVLGTALPPDLTAAITEAYDELADRCTDLNLPVAVRSSAAGEDSGDASFAGIFETYLGIAGADRVVEAVRKCWASLFTPRAVTYRLRRGIDHHDMPMAVGVVELIHARSSGVAFSVHPVTGKPDRIVIEANWGWGEAVVQGLVTPDHLEVGKSDARILDVCVNDKAVVSAFDYAQGRVVEIPMPERLRGRAVLTDDEVHAITEAVTAIERHYGYPVDVEWVVDKHRREGEPVTVVQTRPVTVVAEPADVVGTATGWDPARFASRYAFGGR